MPSYLELGRESPFMPSVGPCSRLLVANRLLSMVPDLSLRWTIDGQDVFPLYFEATQPPARARYGGELVREAIASRHNPPCLRQMAERFRYHPRFLAACQEYYAEHGSPQVAIQVRESDKHDHVEAIDNPDWFYTAVPSCYYLALAARLLQTEPRVFVASDCNMTLTALRAKYGAQIVCSDELDTTRATDLRPRHILGQLGKAQSEYNQLHVLLLDIFIMRQCRRVYFGLVSGPIVLASTMDGLDDPDGALYRNDKYQPVITMQALDVDHRDLVSFYSQRERALWKLVYKLYRQVHGNVD